MAVGDKHVIRFGQFLKGKSKRTEILEPHESIQHRVHEHDGVAIFDHDTPVFEIGDHISLMLPDCLPIDPYRPHRFFSVETLEMILREKLPVKNPPKIPVFLCGERIQIPAVAMMRLCVSQLSQGSVGKGFRVVCSLLGCHRKIAFKASRKKRRQTGPQTPEKAVPHEVTPIHTFLHSFLKAIPAIVEDPDEQPPGALDWWTKGISE
jgi:hypothetical protein